MLVKTKQIDFEKLIFITQSVTAKGNRCFYNRRSLQKAPCEVMEVRVTVTSLSLLQGDQCWRLDRNMVMEPGYPKPVASEFPGLTGNISAALAVPATRSRPETVYFFKNGEQYRKTQTHRGRIYMI